MYVKSVLSDYTPKHFVSENMQTTAKFINHGCMCIVAFDDVDIYVQYSVQNKSVGISQILDISSVHLAVLNDS